MCFACPSHGLVNIPSSKSFSSPFLPALLAQMYDERRVHHVHNKLPLSLFLPLLPSLSLSLYHLSAPSHPFAGPSEVSVSSLHTLVRGLSLAPASLGLLEESSQRVQSYGDVGTRGVNQRQRRQENGRGTIEGEKDGERNKRKRGYLPRLR